MDIPTMDYIAAKDIDNLCSFFRQWPKLPPKAAELNNLHAFMASQKHKTQNSVLYAFTSRWKTNRKFFQDSRKSQKIGLSLYF